MTDTTRADHTWERSRRKGPWRRLRLRRADGQIYLDRWGFAHDRLGGVFLHRMEAPDPGIDLHDHPWAFLSIIVWGGYTEQRALIRDAPRFAAISEEWPETCTRGLVEHRRLFSARRMRLDECHTITHLRRRTSWSLILRGPRVRSWGFYLPDGYMSEREYDATVRAERRDLWSDQRAGERPW